VESKRFRREITDDNIPIGSTNNQWRMNNPPLIEGSLYIIICGTSTKKVPVHKQGGCLEIITEIYFS
jgi:hypothetical protein